MVRSQGFARGDLDSSFPLDDKFLDLRGRLTPERYYAATGVYWTVVAATWREADRKVALRVAPDASSFVEDLVAVGLLDSDGRVPSRVYTNWIGRARRARKAATARQARKRGDSTNTKSELGDTPSSPSRASPVHLSRSVTSLSRVTPRDTAGTVGTEGTDGAVPLRAVEPVGRDGRDWRAREDEEIRNAHRRMGLPVDA